LATFEKKRKSVLRGRKRRRKADKGEGGKQRMFWGGRKRREEKESASTFPVPDRRSGNKFEKKPPGKRKGGKNISIVKTLRDGKRKMSVKGEKIPLFWGEKEERKRFYHQNTRRKSFAL